MVIMRFNIYSLNPFENENFLVVSPCLMKNECYYLSNLKYIEYNPRSIFNRCASIVDDYFPKKQKLELDLFDHNLNLNNSSFSRIKRKTTQGYSVLDDTHVMKTILS